MIGGPPRGELNLQPQTMEAKQNTTEPQSVTKDDLVMRSVNFLSKLLFMFTRRVGRVAAASVWEKASGLQ